MADFSKAQPYILKGEGGYVHDKHDTGGETYRGISRNNFPNWSGWEIVDAHKPLNRGEFINSHILDSMVNEFYKVHFWDNMKGDGITDEKVAGYLYDWYVNAGRNAIKELQKILKVDVDGIVGPGTQKAINAADNTLITMLHNARLDYYKRIAKGDNEKFLKGWLNRANDLYSLV